LLAATIALPASALLIRADRDDAEYLELATLYPSSVLLNAPDGEGVLIAPRWVLTAAHMVKALQEQKPVPRIPIGARSYEIQAFHGHPEWKKGGHSDVGLIYLKEPVTDVAPSQLYKEKDEGGRTMIIVGHGYTGKIGGKPLPKEQWDRKKRAAVNTVDRVSPRTLGMKIKAPEDASDLQGAAAPGDSGGPAFVKVDAVWYVAGIGYATDDTNSDGIVGNVGDWELYVRVSAFATWIEATMLEVAKQEMDALLGEKQ
jgi:hypothetical protein